MMAIFHKKVIDSFNLAIYIVLYDIVASLELLQFCHVAAST